MKNQLLWVWNDTEFIESNNKRSKTFAKLVILLNLSYFSLHLINL